MDTKNFNQNMHTIKNSNQKNGKKQESHQCSLSELPEEEIMCEYMKKFMIDSDHLEELLDKWL